MVRFKVVLEDRGSTFAQGKYRLKYIKDEIVKAVKGTFGIMVFKRRHQAEYYKRMYLSYSTTGIILRVEPLSRGKTVRLVSSLFRDVDLDLFYSGDYSPYAYPPAAGTICYDKVKVLD